MTRYALISRSVEYEARLASLLGPELTAVPGQYLTFGTDEVLERIPETPHIALLGPVLNYEETRQLVGGLTERYPEVGIIVVREQRADLEDWVDGMRLHAVLAPDASDATALRLFDRLKGWLTQVYGTDTAAGDWGGFAVEVPEPEPERESTPSFDDLAGLAVVTPIAVRPPSAEPAEPPELEWLFPAALPQGARSEILAVVAPKGGQGKTTISINLAAALADAAPNSVVLVDADVQFGDIAAALDLHPAHTLVDAASAAATGDELVLKTYLTRHADGFYVVPGTASPELGDDLTAPQLGALLRSLAQIFRYVIVDTTPGLGEHTLAVIENATDAVFVTNMGVPSLRAMRKELELLLQIGLLPNNKHVVLNFSEKQSGLSLRDAERIVGAKMNVVVPRSSAVLLASNRGVPLLHADARDGAAVALRDLALRIDPAAHARRKRPNRRAVAE
ncbi:AAA family ATPase [Agromyces sp. ISL-38]|uniref:AAA family ATPase n=1 Tax=Agromyces sp. ISL-38 TaxID=2819107 RepID=UPI001BE5816F|nr:AAA family ATPase [Agromyces sp. ISL-38]MBT2500747.1 AAA family ATPase [Agromyces sp. ISL-38]